MRALNAKYDCIFGPRKLPTLIIKKWLLVLVQRTSITILLYL